MSGVQLRAMGTTAQFAPVIKRGIATLSDGRAVALSIDANLAASGGTDVTGTAKLFLYVSTDTTRTAWTLAGTLAPVVGAAPTNSTRAGRASMTVTSDNKVWVAWQGVDNALYVSTWTYSAGALTFVTSENVQAAGAITDRFRSIDIDATGASTVAVATYEAAAATGSGSFHRVYVRSNAATWVRAVNLTALATGQFIRAGSEDVSIAWRGDGVVSNVGRFILYGTKTHTTADLGDLIREYSYNVSTAPADGGTILGTWSTAYNQNQAAGTRRAMFYTISTNLYLIAGVIGAGVPQFFSIKLTSGAYGTPTTVNKAGYVSSVALSNYFQIDPTVNNRTYWTTTYRDNQLLFSFVGLGAGSSPRMVREVSMSWANITDANAKTSLDLVPRPTDSGYYGNGGPIAVYGGDNRRTAAGLATFNFVAMYGPGGNTVSTAASAQRVLRFISEDVFDAPNVISPASVEPTSRPTYRVTVQNLNLEPNLYGKIEVNVASDSTFSTNLKTIIQPDSALQYFGSKDGLSGSAAQVAVATASASQALTQGTWYWRARVLSDKGKAGLWSATEDFVVSHPPSANPIFPQPASVVAKLASNNYTFAWTRSDTNPGDTQTAYRVVITRLDTTAVVIDTGFISSSQTSVVVSFDATSLGVMEVPLSWQVQLKDADGVSGALSTAVQYVIGDVPTVSIVSPVFGLPVTTALPTVTWSFAASGGRTQRAYRVSIYENQTPNLLSNYSFESGALTGWSNFSGTASVVSTDAHSGTYSAFITPDGVGVSPRVERTAPITVTEGASYTIEAWVKPNTSGPVILAGINWFATGSVYISTTSITAAPTPGVWQKLVVTGVAPAGAVSATPHAGRGGTPAVGDTCYVDDVSFHVAGTFTDDPLVTTGWRVGAATTYTFTSQVLTDLSPYRITVEVQDTGGLTSIADVSITTDWTEPVYPGGITVTQPDVFKNRIAWTDANRDTDFVAYRVYRRYMKPSLAAFDIDNTATTWYLLYETSDIQTSYTFDDYLAPLNKQVEYVVVQLADRFGSLIESNITTTYPITLTANRYYFVPEVNIGGIASFEAAGVTGDNFSRDIEQETLHVVGRGRQLQVGDDLGYSGTLTIQLRNPATARRDREFFELVSAQYNKLYVKTPFGDVVLIALGNVSTTRQAGYGGYADFADLSVPYMQVIDEALIAREV